MKTISQYKTNILCAIYPNGNGYGFVFIENSDRGRKLVEYGVIRINPICNRKILERIKKSVDYFRPTIVILLDPDGKTSRTRKRTKNLIKDLVVYAESEKLQVFKYSREQIRSVFELFGAATRYEITKLLLTEFTELEPKRPKEKKLWESEDRNMAIFDALSLALTWSYLNS